MAYPQLTFDFPVSASVAGSDFCITDSNREAVALVNGFAHSLHRRILLIGETGAGKTHLAHIWAEQNRAHIIEAQAIINESLPAVPFSMGGGDVPMAIDNIDSLVQQKDGETALFHFYNSAVNSGCALLLTSRMPLMECGFVIPDLLSRLRTLPVAELPPPDDDLLAMVLVKLFADRQIYIDAATLAFVIKRIPRSFAALGQIVDRADKLTMEKKKRLTIPMLADIIGQDSV